MSSLPPKHPRKRRRWAWALATLVLVAGLLALALPRAVSSDAGRRWLLAKANRALAPGRLEIASIRFSWFGPTQMEHFAIRDAQGDRVVDAAHATWDRNFGQILFDRPRYGTLELDGVVLDVERSAEGKVDLAEALRPILGPDPKVDLTIRARRGRFHLTSPGLDGPLVAESFDLTIRRPPRPRPVSWALRLTAKDGAKLDCVGEFNRWVSGTPTLGIAFEGRRWPLALDLNGRKVGARFQGVIGYGRMDSAHPETSSSSDAPFEGEIGLTDLARGSFGDLPTPEEVKVRWRGSYQRGRDRLELSEWSLGSREFRVDGAGQFEGPLDRLTAQVEGRLAPEADAVARLIVERAGTDARLEGLSGRFRFAGRVADLAQILNQSPGAGSQATLAAELSVEWARAKVFGLEAGPTKVEGKIEGGRVAFAPIEGTLNGGRFHLEPELVREGENPVVLRLKPGSRIEGAVVDDEVSRKVLAFVAPVLERATNVHGRVSAQVDRAEVPLVRGAGSKLLVEGKVTFEDVEFAPGPLSQELLDLVGRGDKTLKLDAPVLLTIAEGRVRQQGFAIPLGNLTRVELEGSVGFDKQLDLRASVPLTSAMVANNPLLSDIVEGTRVSVPIGGTLEHAKVDREAFRTALNGLGKSLLERSALRGVAGLLMRLARPRDAEAAPPAPRLTPAERKAQRLERRERKRRGQDS